MELKGWKRGLAVCLIVLVLLGIAVTAVWRYQAYTKSRLIAGRGFVQIVCFGDSIWDICRDETGIAALVEEKLEGQAKVYNLCIMGTTASERTADMEDAEQWNTKSMLSVIMAAMGDESALPAQERERLQLGQTALKETDYFLLAFGLNDYYCAVPREGEDPYDVYTYEGALRTAVEMLQEHFPQAKVLILSQTYCQGYSYGKVDTESDWKDWGGGTGPDYAASARKVAEEYGLIFVDNYNEMGINIHNGTKYLSDATHLTERGRRKYADILVKALLKDFGDN